ncbi:MAG: pyruvate dehydrogenase complex dihydrolipoamide acetyltransferase [Acidobacteria bacterium]|nr:MAG: pyruvate dehydrogenase complex dihydrolipoamide acetyltransferase [Acidobacteriota bacterium]
MAQIIMPRLSDTMTDGVVVRWLKKPGDVVNMGDVLAEIETDKATMEMEAFDEGVLKEIYVQEGQKIAVGEPIALISGEEEEPASPAPVEKIHAVPKRRIAQEKARIPQPKLAEVQHARDTADVEEGYSQAHQKRVATAGLAASSGAAGNTTGGRVKASPLARKVASKMNLDLSRIEGSGPGGRIIQEDVLAAAGQKTVVSTPSVVALPVGSGAEAELIPLTPMRRVIAQRMVESKSQIPHFYLQVELDAGPMLQLRSQANESLALSGGGKLSINDFVLKACVEALRRVPAVNSSFSDNAILRYKHVHLGFAVSLEEGLITPIIRNAENKSLRQISAEAKELSERARARKLKPEEYQGGTFTVSNLGGFGIDNFQAIINPPQAAILAVGSVIKKPVVSSPDQIVVGQRLGMTLCCDHRVVDGATGALFLQELRKLIENPTLMLI